MLTKSEQQIMDFLWDIGEPVTTSDIVKQSIDKTWKNSYIHLLINSLLKKEMIKVEGFVQTTKSYARTFVPAVTREEYAVKSITGNKKFAPESLPILFSALLEEDVDAETIDKIAEIVKKKQEEIKCK